MKKTVVLFAGLMLVASSALAAGKMSNITQNIQIKDATIEAKGHKDSEVIIGGIGESSKSVNKLDQIVNINKGKSTIEASGGGKVRIATVEKSKIDNVTQQVDIEDSTIRATGSKSEVNIARIDGADASGGFRQDVKILNTRQVEASAGGKLNIATVKDATVTKGEQKVTINSATVKAEGNGSEVNIASISGKGTVNNLRQTVNITGKDTTVKSTGGGKINVATFSSSDATGSNNKQEVIIRNGAQITSSGKNSEVNIATVSGSKVSGLEQKVTIDKATISAKNAGIVDIATISNSNIASVKQEVSITNGTVTADQGKVRIGSIGYK